MNGPQDNEPITILEISQKIEGKTVAIGALLLHPYGLKLELSDAGDTSKEMSFALVGCDLRTNPDDLSFLEDDDCFTTSATEQTSKKGGQA